MTPLQQSGGSDQICSNPVSHRHHIGLFLYTTSFVCFSNLVSLVRLFQRCLWARQRALISRLLQKVAQWGGKILSLPPTLHFSRGYVLIEDVFSFWIVIFFFSLLYLSRMYRSVNQRRREKRWASSCCFLFIYYCIYCRLEKTERPVWKLQAMTASIKLCAVPLPPASLSLWVLRAMTEGPSEITKSIWRRLAQMHLQAAMMIADSFLRLLVQSHCNFFLQNMSKEQHYSAESFQLL